MLHFPSDDAVSVAQPGPDFTFVPPAKYLDSMFF